MSFARTFLLASLALLLLSGTAFGLSEALHRQEDSTTVVTQPVRRLIVRADVGNVDIRAGLTSNVVVMRHDTWLLHHPRVRLSYAGGALTVQTNCGGLRSVLRCRTNLAIDAPPDVDVDVRTDAGDVDLRGLSGRADIRTGSGDIRTHRLEPIVIRAATDAGNVALDLFGEPARTEARSTAGDVRIVVPFGSYRVDATTDAGTVDVVGLIRDDLAPQAIDAVTDAGDITVRAR